MARTHRNRYPLRCIVAIEPDGHGRMIELLDCGHRQPERVDIYGPTVAARRRCRACWEAATCNGSSRSPCLSGYEAPTHTHPVPGAGDDARAQHG